MQGHKELLGLWISENEGAKFWLNIVTELQKPWDKRCPHRLWR